MHAFVPDHPCAACNGTHHLCHPGRSWLAPGISYHYTCPATGGPATYRRPSAEPTFALGGIPAGSVALEDEGRLI